MLVLLRATRRRFFTVLSAACVSMSVPSWADLPADVARVSASVVAVGTLQPGRSPQFRVLGTGFAVGDGSTIATNFHVVPEVVDDSRMETLAIAVPARGATTMAVREVRKIASDPAHDLVLLKLSSGPGLPPLPLNDGKAAREGEDVAFTGFPMGDTLGLFPVTHRGIVSAIAPIGIPTARARDLDARLVRQLSTGPFDILQLDAVAYPGHSGSPLFDVQSGEVIGILNMVFVKGTRESALSQPSGISYAVPARFLQDIIRNARTSP